MSERADNRYRTYLYEHGTFRPVVMLDRQGPLRFQGQYFDEEPRLHYNRHLYYPPGSGPFLMTDPIKLVVAGSGS